MCGIAGVWRFDGPRPGDGQRLERMADSLLHRGPDDFGYLLANATTGQISAGQHTNPEFSPDVLLASRRLSILDLSPQGRQPMGNEAGDTFVVFNGAIHNYLELREELEDMGHIFCSQTDTEVIVHAYEEWGAECAARFNGMWAYAIWDKRHRQLVCSRDRFGIKPLLICRKNNSFYFASEAKAILSAGDVPAVANSSFLRRFLSTLVPVNGNQTAFEGIEQVPAGYNLIVSSDGFRQVAYWSYGDQSQQYDYDHPDETFRELFADAMRIRMRSDVPIALLLSGGLDSSSIAVHAQQESGGQLEAFTFTFPGYKADERRYAAIVAQHSGVRQHFLEFDPSNLLDDLASVAWHMDAPSALGQTLARWHLLQAASQVARIVFEGQGADEMLGGYPQYYRRPYIRSELNRLGADNFHRVLPCILSAYFKLHPTQFRGTLHTAGLYAKYLLARKSGAPRSIMAQDLAAGANPNDFPTFEATHEFPDRLTNVLQRDHAHDMLPYLLNFGDALSMAHSVESRLPFLDHRLVEFIFGLPFDEKIRGSETKRILRRAFAEKLPPRVRDRSEKVGFETPLQEWLKPGSQPEVREKLTSQRVRERGILNPAVVDQCLDGLDADRPGMAFIIFRCLALESWFEQFIDRDWQQN